MTIFRWPLPCCRAAVIALAALALGVGPGAAQTLAAVKQRGTLVCGVSEGILGFSTQTDKGWSGFDVDLCRALAAAVFGDAGKVRYVPLTAIKWTIFAMIDAEELGVSSTTIDEAVRSAKPDIRRLVGTEGNFGEQAGLTRDWAVRIVRQVGNYGEVFERNVGTDSRLGIPRGLNQFWTAGGILYAPPIR